MLKATDVTLENLTKVFGQGDEAVRAVDSVSTQIRGGELFILLGPSGCGKTTTLRMIAGLELPTSGKILYDNEDFTRVSVQNRKIAMVFQSYALFPHLSVFENVAYGLRVRKEKDDEINRKVLETLELVGLKGVEKRKPTAMSGGQQQRVSLARALVYDPRLLLLDEPLSNLDAKLRVYMREEIRKVQTASNKTAIYVTHDQEEALSIADRIAVMDRGKIVQLGTPEELYETPNALFVGDFVGKSTVLLGEVESVDNHGARVVVLGGSGRVAVQRYDAMPQVTAGTPVALFSRPERLSIAPRSNGELSLNSVEAELMHVSYLGQIVRHKVRMRGQEREALVDTIDKIAGVEKPGTPVQIEFNPAKVAIFTENEQGISLDRATIGTVE